MTSNKFNELFAEYDKRGFRLVAWKPDYDKDPPKKKPIMTGWPKIQDNGVVYDAVCSEAEAGIGIQTGSKSQLVVLDFDNAEKAEKFYESLREAKLTTATVRTGGSRGSVHFYFRTASGLWIQSRHLDGLDLLGNGKFAVAPPSFHPDTRREYEWIEPLDRLREWVPGVNEIAGLEPDLTSRGPRQVEFKFRGTAQKRGIRCVDEIRSRVLKVGERDATLHALYSILRSNGDNQYYAKLQVEDLNQRAVEPLPAGDIKRICRPGQAYKFGCARIQSEFNISQDICEGCPRFQRRAQKMIKAADTRKIIGPDIGGAAAKLYVASKTGYINPEWTQSEIADAMGVERRTVLRAIKELKHRGITWDL